MGSSQDTEAFIPLSSSQFWLGTKQLSQVIVRTPTPSSASLADNLLTRLYAKRYQNSKVILVSSEDQLLSTLTSTQKTFTELLGGTAIVALVVGGIGIMNIMLVSVTERTREIGTRQALGASPEDIILQFLLEAIGLSLLGGLLGTVLGVSSAQEVSHILGLATVINGPSVVLAASTSILVGLIFGLYPAIKASRLNSIDALRYN